LGIRNQTAPQRLDFDPTVAANGETLKETQLINLGWAVYMRQSSRLDGIDRGCGCVGGLTTRRDRCHFAAAD
jgi:hypothetical protein